jgi:hypothetical protein
MADETPQTPTQEQLLAMLTAQQNAAAARSASAEKAPKIDFGTHVTMPGAPVVNGQPIQSVIGSDAARSKAYQHFQTMWDRAGSNPPKLADFNGDMARYKAADTAFNNNPLTLTRKRLEAEYQHNLKAQNSPEDAVKIHKAGVQDALNNYMKGIDRGLDDPTINENRQNAFQKLLGGDIQGALQSFLMTIPAVGMRVKAAYGMAMSYMTGERLSFNEAYDNVILERAYGGAAQSLGLDNNGVAAMVNEGRTFGRSRAEAVKPAAAPSKIEIAPAQPAQPAMVKLDATFKMEDAKAIAEVNKEITDGKIIVKDGIGYATQEALQVLDNKLVPGQTPSGQTANNAREGASWEAGK